MNSFQLDGRIKSQNKKYTTAIAMKAPRLSSTLFVLFVLFSFVGFTPFDDRVRVNLATYQNDGNLLRQIFLVLTFAYLIFRCGRRAASRSLRLGVPVYFIMIWTVLSVIWSVDPEITLKRLFLTWLVFGICFLFTIELGTSRILLLLTASLSLLVGISLISGLFLQNALHRIGEPSEIVGAWRGIFPHKNNAGFAAAVAFLLCLYHFLLSRNYTYIYISAINVFFLILTESKTAFIITAISASMLLFIEYITRRGLRSTVLSMATIYSAFSSVVFLFILYEPIAATLTDPTKFTNRSYIWALVYEIWEKNFFVGIGFGALWEVDSDKSVLKYLLSGEFLAATQGHNGYLDIAATTGLIGLFASFVAFFARPVLRLLSTGSSSRNSIMANYILVMLFFMGFYNMLESVILRNYQSTWLILSLLCSLAALFNTSQEKSIPE